MDHQPRLIAPLAFAALLGSVLGSVLGWAPSVASAQTVGDPAGADGAVPPSEEGDPPPSVPRATLTTQVDVGLLALPFAKSQPFADAPEEPGEAGLGAGVHVLGRIGNLGFGAGFTYGLGFKTSEAPGNSPLAREHSRLYYLLDGVFRYYLPTMEGLTWWFAASAGVAVVNDTWTNLADRDPASPYHVVGLKKTTILSEGFMAGVELGAHHKFLDRWIVGGRVRYSNWILPGPREHTPFGDRASLGGELEPLGRIDVIETGLLVGFEYSL